MPASSCCSGNLFDTAIMKTSVISKEFRERYLSNPEGPQRLRGPRHRVRRAGGLSPPHRRSRARDRRALHPVHARHRPDRLSRRRRGGEHAAARRADQDAASLSLPCIGDGRQSGTSGSPSILNASPEAAAGGGLALLKTGDRVRDRPQQAARADILISDDELEQRRAELQAPRAASTTRPTRRRGRRSSARRSTSNPTAPAWSSPPAITHRATVGVARDNH